MMWRTGGGKSGKHAMEAACIPTTETSSGHEGGPCLHQCGEWKNGNY